MSIVESKLDDIRKLKSKGTGFRNLKNFKKALEIYEQAIAELRALDASNQVLESEAGDVRAELADTYGIEGGTYRRWADLPNHLDLALERYRTGLEIERIDKRSTYNASNVITLAITQEKKPLDAAIMEDLDRVIQGLEAYTAGPRADEFWAWADLGQFYLLRNDLEQARASYRSALERGPTTAELRRHIEILHELVEATRASAKELSLNVQAVIAELQQWQPA